MARVWACFIMQFRKRNFCFSTFKCSYFTVIGWEKETIHIRLELVNCVTERNLGPGAVRHGPITRSCRSSRSLFAWERTWMWSNFCLVRLGNGSSFVLVFAKYKKEKQVQGFIGNYVTYKDRLSGRPILGNQESLTDNRQLRKCMFRCVPAEYLAFPSVRCYREWTEVESFHYRGSIALELEPVLHLDIGIPPHDLIKLHSIQIKWILPTDKKRKRERKQRWEIPYRPRLDFFSKQRVNENRSQL
jgi:hypothetical protein